MIKTLSIQKRAAFYFLFQCLAGLSWWISMGLSSEIRSWFSGKSDFGLLQHFLVADALIFVAGSGLASWALFHKHKWAAPICWALTGATFYAGIFCLQSSLTGDLNLLCAVLMIPACMLSLHATLMGTQLQGFPFNTYHSSNSRRALATALIQTVIFYGIFFGALPWLILRAQTELRLPRFTLPWWGILGAGLGFCLGGLLAIRSTFIFAQRGKGTPLPTHSPKNLVVSGPYAYVRNPMAIGGIFQGVMVGLVCGSFPVMIYSLTGSLIWHLLVRPVEEADLVHRFGDDYLIYCRSIKCWWPARSPYTPHS
ncbi:methyltransferase [Kiritimatiellota bacterium B12222]|nr:methyltransferase [Kiritimatiellota bacterium B12222]